MSTIDISLLPYVVHVYQSALVAAVQLIGPFVIFLFLAVLVQKHRSFESPQGLVRESKLNLTLHFLDAILITPVLALVIASIISSIKNGRFTIGSEGFWSEVPVIVVGFCAVFAGDFIGYFRHRLEHSKWLWPAHAIHHSDTELTWLSIARFHPVNRLSTEVIDTGFLALLDFPIEALIANSLVRRYYGMFIHAGLPWTYGKLGRVLVSPAMHRWHHVADAPGIGSNFATVFSVFDQCFGTYYVPGVCISRLGVREDMGRGVAGQLLYPFRIWFRGRRRIAAGIPIRTHRSPSHERPEEPQQFSNLLN